MSYRGRKLANRANKEEEVKELQQVEHGGEQTEQGHETQELPDQPQGEQQPSRTVDEIMRKIVSQTLQDDPPTQKVSTPPAQVQYRILTRNKKSNPPHPIHSSGEESLQEEQLQRKILLPEKAHHGQHQAEKSLGQYSNPHPSTSYQSYPRYQTGPQELPQDQSINTQMQMQYGQLFPQQLSIEPTPQMADDHHYNPIAHVDLNYELEDPSQFNYPLYLGSGPDVVVLCPMGRLPAGACHWKGENRYRKTHVDTNHTNFLISTNFIKMSFNCVTVMNVYAEYFLCYTVKVSNPDQFYCIVQHACTAYNCMLSYQYRCEIYAENQYEKISVTRLVGHFRDNFITLTQMGNCLCLDPAVVSHFTGADGFNVHFTVLMPEPVSPIHSPFKIETTSPSERI